MIAEKSAGRKLNSAGTRDFLFLDEQEIAIPERAMTFEGFCKWACSDDYPEKARISWIGEEIFIDMTPEKADSHVSVKQAFNRVIDPLAEELNLGIYFPDGLRIIHRRAKLSTMPDACVIGHKAVAEGRIKRILDSDGEDCTSLAGSPDWVLEIISNSSVKKDTTTLKTRYFRAGVQEYWLVDARRKDQIDFQIFVRGKDEFKSQPRNGGWLTSPYFARRFSLRRRTYPGDFWRYELQVALLAGE